MACLWTAKIFCPQSHVGLQPLLNQYGNVCRNPAMLNPVTCIILVIILTPASTSLAKISLCLVKINRYSLSNHTGSLICPYDAKTPIRDAACLVVGTLMIIQRCRFHTLQYGHSAGLSWLRMFSHRKQGGSVFIRYVPL